VISTRKMGRLIHWAYPGNCYDAATEVRIVNHGHPVHNSWRLHYQGMIAGDGPYDYFYNALWRLDQVHGVCVLIRGLLSL
jgi:hypothetical protein